MIARSNKSTGVKSECLMSGGLPLGTGLTMLGFLFFMLLLASVCLLSIPLSPLFTPLSLLLGGLLTLLLLRSWRIAFCATIISAVFIALTAWLCSLVYDTAFDCIAYHYGTVIMLADGWNPVLETPPTGNLWSEYYVRGLELMQASFLAFSGNLQSVKCINFVFWASALLVMWHALGVMFPRISRRGKALSVIVAASNVVVVSQLLTGLNDFALWLETLLLLSAFCMVWKNSRSITAYIIIFITIAIGANTKFTHMGYMGVECLGFAVMCLVCKRRKIIVHGVISVIAGYLVGVVVIGFNPYITSTLRHSNPVYPLGTDKVDIMTSNTPEMMTGDERVINMAKSLLSVDGKPWALVKFDFDAKDFINTYSASGERVNGFGFFMPLLLVAGLILMIISRAGPRWWVVYCGTWVMCFFFEQSWWARYIPFLWLNVLLPYVLSLNNPAPRRRLQIIFRSLIVTLSVAGAAVCGAGSLISRIGYTHYFNYVCDRSRELGKPLECANISLVFETQFKERGVETVELPSDTKIPHDSEFYRIFGTDYFDAVVHLPAEDYPRLSTSAPTLLDKLSNYPSRRY